MSRSSEGEATDGTTDVLIVGGGVCGTALLFLLARYSDLSRLTLVERRPGLAQVNSRASSNSQTIHCGDIETNYSLEKALSVQRTAAMIGRYAQLLEPAERDRCVFRLQKMVIGVGEQECDLLRRRHGQFAPHFPGMQLLDKEQIAAWEPAVALVEGQPRPESLAAIGIRDEVTAADFEALSRSFADQAGAAVAGSGRTVDLRLESEVERITPEDDGFRVTLHHLRPPPPSATADAAIAPQRTTLHARHVVVNAGGHSLLLAQRMGYGLEFSCLPVAGSFYFTPDLLRGKVYTVQNDRLPFAAIHGDPDVRTAGRTRFGPTALLLPMLERYRPESFLEFLEVLRLDGSVLEVFRQLLAVPDIRAYILRNLLFEVPLLRRRLFLSDARKIVPGLRLEDLRFAAGYGGVRPQLIDRNRRRLLLGEVSIAAAPGLVFNVTPSPGATCCLGNALRDGRTIAARLGCRLDQARIRAELGGEEAGSA